MAYFICDKCGHGFDVKLKDGCPACKAEPDAVKEVPADDARHPEFTAAKAE